MTQNEEFDFDRPYTQPPAPDDDMTEIPLEEQIDDLTQAQLVNSAIESARLLTTDALYRDRRGDEIELAHVEEDLKKRLLFLVNQLPDRVWPGKNEEARALSKETARASDRVCQKLDRRRRTLEAQLSAMRGEIEARESLESQRRAAQKDLELDLTRKDLEIRSRFADLDAQMRAADLVLANRNVPLDQLRREREERISLVAQYLK